MESADSSWGELAQKRLFESELTGKGFQPKVIKASEPIKEGTKAQTSSHSSKKLIFKNLGFVNRKWTEILVI